MEAMQHPAHSSGGLSAALDALSRRPWLLAALALALGSFAQPYAHLTHDARLYSVQVLNRAEGGSYATDLFFRYGSQDSYTIFSTLAGPVAGAIGVPWTFFLLYLLARVLFVLAGMRLSFAILGTTRAAVVTTLLLAGLPVAFGALGIFQVNEAFLTPRLPAFGLVLLGVAELLIGRGVLAGLFFLLAGTLHPLIAAVSVPLLLGWLLCRRWPEAGLPLVATVLLTGEALILGIPALGRMVFGSMDATWLDEVSLFTRYNFPFQWTAADWGHTGLSLGVVILAALVVARTSPERGNLLGLVALLGLAGFLATTLSSVYGYRVLFQAQPYRMLWLVNLIAVPGVVLLVVRAWAAGSEWVRLAALVLAVAVLMPGHGINALALACGIAPVVLLLLRGRTPHWLSVGVATSLALAFAVVEAAKMATWGSHTLEYTLRGLTVGLWVPVLLVALVLLPSLLRAGVGRVGLAAVALFLALNGTTFAVRQLPSLRGPQGPDAHFVASVIEKRPGNEPRPTVFWSVENVDLVWLDLHACSYFNRLQAVGAIFNRDTAAEATRRARRVAHFDLARLRTSVWTSRLETLYALRVAQAAPSREHLDRLVAEETLDYVVTDRDLGGRHLATNGRVFVYDCRQLRAGRRSGRNDSVGLTSIR
jgi:hypothetical protein